MKFLNTKTKNEEPLESAPTADSKTREKRKAELVAAIEKAREGTIETTREIETLLQAEDEKKRIYNKEIEKILEDAQDASVKRQIDLTYQTSNRDLKQVRSNLEKMYLLKGRYALQERKASAELAQIKAQIESERVDSKIKDVFGEKLSSWLSAYREAQAKFNEFKAGATDLMDTERDWLQRLSRLGFSSAHMTIADSYLRNLRNTGMDTLAGRIADMATGTGYANMPEELKLDVDYSRQVTRPVVRDEFYLGDDAQAVPVEQPVIGDEAAMEAL